MSNVEQYLSDAKKKTKKEFVHIYPHPFLVQYLESNPEESMEKIGFATLTSFSLNKIIKQNTKKEIKNIIPIVKSDRNPFAGKITIGRTSVQKIPSTQDIVIEDPSISKFHGYFEIKEGGEYTIYDRNSKNGITLNGIKIIPATPKPIKDMDEISFSGVCFNYYLPETAYNVFKKAGEQDE